MLLLKKNGRIEEHVSRNIDFWKRMFFPGKKSMSKGIPAYGTIRLDVGKEMLCSLHFKNQFRKYGFDLFAQ